MIKCRKWKKWIIGIFTVMMLMGVMSVSALAYNYLDPADIDLNVSSSGEGWSYSSSDQTLLVEDGAEIYVDSETPFECRVVNNGTIIGVNDCHFNNDVANNGTIIGAYHSQMRGLVVNAKMGKIDCVAITGTLLNYGTVTDSNFPSETVIENYSGATICCEDGIFSWIPDAEITNEGTIADAIIHGSVTNSGVLDTCSLGVEATLVNTETGELKNTTVNCDYPVNVGILSGETTTIGQEFENKGTITGGNYEYKVTNSGTISGGMFQKDVANNGVINGGVFKANVTNNGTITGGTFYGGVDNQTGITSGEFYGEVSNPSFIEGGTFYADSTVTNSGNINDGTFKGTVENNGNINDGVFEGQVNNSEGAAILGGEFSSVANSGTIKGGSIESCLNSGTIEDGNIVDCENHGMVMGGTFTGTMEGDTVFIFGGNFTGIIKGIELKEMDGLTVNCLYDMGCMYLVRGNAVLRQDLTIPVSSMLSIDDGDTLTITDGATLTLAAKYKLLEDRIFTENGGQIVYRTNLQQSRDWSDIVERYNKDTVTSADRETLEKALEALPELLADENLSEENKALLEKAKTGANDLLALLDEAAAAKNTENIQKVANITSENVKASDKSELEAAKADLESALNTYGKNYTEAEKTAIQGELDRINAALAAIPSGDKENPSATDDNKDNNGDNKDNVNDDNKNNESKNDGNKNNGDKDQKSPATGDESQWMLWALTFVGFLGAAAVLAMRKSRQN